MDITIGDNLKELRKKKNNTQEDLADKSCENGCKYVEKNKYSVEEIVEATELTVEKIQELKEQNENKNNNIKKTYMKQNELISDRMKNIIIAGPSRAGKTTLATRLNEELNYFVISLDKIVATFGRAYPQMDIRLHSDYEKMKDNLAPFLGHFLGVFSDFRHVEDDQNFRARVIKGNRFVLEGTAFSFDMISSVLNMYGIEKLNEHFILIGLVQNKKTADEFVRDFRKYDTEDDWTYGWSDEELREYAISRAIPFNREMTEHLVKYGFTVYDTSIEREQVLAQIIYDIKAQIGITCKSLRTNIRNK